MKRLSIILMTFFISLSAFSELKYIEIDSKQNLPTIRIKTIEEFESIINAYDISLVFLQYNSDSKSPLLSSQKTSEAFIIASNTYFSFPMEGYKTLADYKAGKSANFKNSRDYEKSKSLGIDNSEFFYYYVRNSFKTVDDSKDAYKNGFVFYTTFKTETNYLSGQKYLAVIEDNPKNKESDAYYEAKKLGYTSHADYKEYLDYTENGFKTKDEYLVAKSKGFYKAEDLKTAIEAGFIDGEEYKNAKLLGLQTKSDFTRYNEITSSIDKIMSEKKIDKKNALIYYFVQILPKGEKALSVLSKTLTENYNANSPELKSALSFYANDVKNRQEYELKRKDKKNRSNIINIMTLFLPENLKKFFSETDISQLGSYNSQSEIFKKK